MSLADTDAVSTITLDPAGSDDSLVVSGASGEVVLSLADDYSANTVGVTVNGATGLTVNNSAAIGGDIDITAADATTVTVALKHTSDISVDALTVASATTVNLGGNNTDTVGAAFAGNISVASLVAAKGTTLNVDTNQGNVAVATLTAAKLTGITIVGDGTFTAGATAATTTALASIDGATATGAITVTQNMDFASGATIKTGFANDSVTIDVLTEGNVEVDMGEFTADTDTLLIAGANNMGLTVIDLSAADQISQLNGAVNTTSQTGIENITLSGLSGSFGATVTGSADANIIIGTGTADNFIAGGGSDTITGRGGNDTIDLSEATAKQDFIRLESTVSANGLDTITGLGTTDMITLDKSDYSLNGTATADSANTAIAAATYYEGAVGSATAGTAYDVMVLTGASYANVGAAEDAVSGQMSSATDGFVIFHVTGTTTAMMFFDADLATDDGLTNTAAVITFAGIADNDAALKAALSVSNFELIA
jgi:hypothetical protein